MVNSVKHLLNRRPRKTLNYATPHEEFFRKIFGVDCALQGWIQILKNIEVKMRDSI